MPDSQHVYEVRPRKDKRGADLISDVLPFGRLWYAEPDAISHAISYAKFYSRSRRDLCGDRWADSFRFGTVGAHQTVGRPILAIVVDKPPSGYLLDSGYT